MSNEIEKYEIHFYIFYIQFFFAVLLFLLTNNFRSLSLSLYRNARIDWYDDVFKKFRRENSPVGQRPFRQLMRQEITWLLLKLLSKTLSDVYARPSALWNCKIAKYIWFYLIKRKKSDIEILYVSIYAMI